jgi:hemolysin activation/secretion protein
VPRKLISVIIGIAGAGTSAHAQMPLDQSNTAIIQRDAKPLSEAPPPSRITVERDSADLPAPTSAPAGGIFIGAIRVSGAKAIPIEAFAAAIEPFIGKGLSNTDLANASRAVADVARARGYKFASAFVAPQSLALGVLTITLDEGAISAVRIEGSKNRQFRKIVSALEGKARPYNEIEHRLLLAADLPGIAVQKIRYAREDGRGVLIITVSEDNLSGVAGLDTLGNKSTGPVRAFVSLNASNLATSGDQLSVQAASTPLQPNELAFAALSYSLPLDSDSTVVSGSVTYGRSQPGGFLKQFDSTGRSVTYSASLTRQIIRSRTTNLFVAAKFEQLSSRQSLLGVRVRDTKISAVSFTVGGNRIVAGGRLRSEATLTQGFDAFGATQRGDPQSSRSDAGAGFTKLNLEADWTGKISGPISLRLATEFQVTEGPLFAEYELGIGGTRFGRAYSFSERSGDNGAVGLAELRTDFNKIAKWLNWAQAYTFIDAGRVTNLESGFGGGALFSGGGGVRARLGTIDVGVESAFPLNADRFDSDDRSPRFNLNLSTRF